MNAGCAIVANRRMGSVPFLIKNGETGFMYENYQDLENKIKQVMDNKELRTKFGKNAYKLISGEWESKVAVENMIKLFESITEGKEFDVKDGPASKATKYTKPKEI